MLKKEEIKFKAAVLTKIKRKLEFDNLVLKNLSKGQVLVKIIFSSICRSQIMEIEGKRIKGLYDACFFLNYIRGM